MPRKKSIEPKERMVHIRLTEDLHRQLKIRVAHEGLTIQDWISKLLEERLDKRLKEKN